MKRIVSITQLEEGHWSGTYKDLSGGNGEVQFLASPDLEVISMAWEAGCDFEDLADGFGLGLGTMGDWSAIRDSSTEQIDLMLARALNFIMDKLEG